MSQKNANANSAPGADKVQKQADAEKEKEAEKVKQQQEASIVGQLQQQGIDVYELDEKFYQDYVEAKKDPTGEAMEDFMDEYDPAPYELGRLERRIEADENDGQIEVYTSGRFEGMTRGEAEIAMKDPRFNAQADEVEEQEDNAEAEAEAEVEEQE